MSDLPKVPDKADLVKASSCGLICVCTHKRAASWSIAHALVMGRSSHSSCKAQTLPQV